MSLLALYSAGGLIFAVGLAAWWSWRARRAEAVLGADEATAAVWKARAAEFGRALVVVIPMAAFLTLFTWFVNSPYFNPPRGAIR